MLASLTGQVQSVGLTSAVIETGGVGFRVHATAATLSTLRPGSRAQLATSLVVREESLTLYGFAEMAELELFEILQSVSGVGPKLALAILSVHTPGTLADAVNRDDHAALRRVPGVGDKSARRLILELQGKVGSITPQTPAQGSDDDVITALEGLGWAPKAAAAAVEKARQELDGVQPENPGQLLRASLRQLGGSS